MNGFRIVAPLAFYWLLVLPLIAGLLWYGVTRRARALKLVGETPGLLGRGNYV